MYLYILPSVTSSIAIPLTNSTQGLDKIFWTDDFVSGVLLGITFCCFIVAFFNSLRDK